MCSAPFAALAAAALLATVATAQIPPVIPYARTFDLTVVDSTFDGVWRLSDQNQDGDYNDPGEITSYYSDVVGAIAWSSPTAIVCGQDGTVYVTEISNDQIYALRDGNGNGAANDPGEIRVFFDGTNLSGFAFPFGYGITIDALGRLLVTVNNATTPAGPDRILLLQDLTGDGDAQDVGEAIDYYTFPGTTGSLAASIPVKIAVGPDGNVYYTQVGTGFTRGAWRLEDLNTDGDCNDAGEATLFWTPPFSTAPQNWGFCVDNLGYFYVTDHASGNEKVWRGRDANGSGTIEPGEQTLFYQTAGSSWWDAVVRDDGTLLLCDSDTPDKITALKDLNSDGDAIDPGESYQAYLSGTASVAVSVRGAAFFQAPRFEPIAPVQFGQTTSLVVLANKPGDLCISVFSIGPGVPFPLAPWGTVEIDISQFLVFGFGLADVTGAFPHPFTAPNTPSAVGTYAFQALCGDSFRLFLSNSTPLSITL